MVENLTSELESLFRSMRAGGVVVTVGAISGQYRRVYKHVDQIARRELMKRPEKLHSRIPLSYSDQYTGRIKALYRKV